MSTEEQGRIHMGVYVPPMRGLVTLPHSGPWSEDPLRLASPPTSQHDGAGTLAKLSLTCYPCRTREAADSFRSMRDIRQPTSRQSPGGLRTIRVQTVHILRLPGSTSQALPTLGWTPGYSQSLPSWAWGTLNQLADAFPQPRARPLGHNTAASCSSTLDLRP